MGAERIKSERENEERQEKERYSKIWIERVGVRETERARKTKRQRVEVRE